MAAHIKTVFEQVLAGTVTPEQLKHGLGYAQFGDNLGFLSYVEWSKLNLACDDGEEAMLNWVKALAPKYDAIWEKIGKPRTAEEWNEMWYEWQKKELAS